jgi:outer membrane protein OmpA-like peptidoglycan-associated protein
MGKLRGAASGTIGLFALLAQLFLIDSKTQAAPTCENDRLASWLLFYEDKAITNDTAIAQKILNEAATTALGLLAAGKLRRVYVVGHTDYTFEGDPVDFTLSRAAHVSNELKSRGLPSALLVQIGRGPSEPLVPMSANAPEPQNQRVEIVLCAVD